MSFYRYSLICVGAASGVASAFSSPISGLTFAMEEISSHWSKKQTWKTFVCCILARSTTELLQSLAFTLRDYKHKMDILQLSESALFDVSRILFCNDFL
jgi:H+/Cl- antiporter ClcA